MADAQIVHRLLDLVDSLANSAPCSIGSDEECTTHYDNTCPYDEAKLLLMDDRYETVVIPLGTQPVEFDAINNPKHYNSHPSGIEVIDITRHESFNLGNAIKYILRHSHKDGLEDLRKAVWYILDEISRLYKINTHIAKEAVKHALDSSILERENDAL